MKKVILKTALITLGAAIACGAILIVILCFAAPKVMMDFTASMGMEGVSGNFANSEWERSGDMECLARSFLTAEKGGDDETASARWDVLYAADGFADYCESGAPDFDDLPAYGYREYLAGCAARVKYRLASDEGAKDAVLGFAFAETDPAFAQGNPVIALSAEALTKGDTAFLSQILSRLDASEFERNEDFTRLTEKLEASIHG